MDENRLIGRKVTVKSEYRKRFLKKVRQIDKQGIFKRRKIPPSFIAGDTLCNLSALSTIRKREMIPGRYPLEYFEIVNMKESDNIMVAAARYTSYTTDFHHQKIYDIGVYKRKYGTFGGDIEPASKNNEICFFHNEVCFAPLIDLFYIKRKPTRRNQNTYFKYHPEVVISTKLPKPDQGNQIFDDGLLFYYDELKKYKWFPEESGFRVNRGTVEYWEMPGEILTGPQTYFRLSLIRMLHEYGGTVHRALYLAKQFNVPMPLALVISYKVCSNPSSLHMAWGPEQHGGSLESCASFTFAVTKWLNAIPKYHNINFKSYEYISSFYGRTVATLAKEALKFARNKPTAQRYICSLKEVLAL